MLVAVIAAVAALSAGGSAAADVDTLAKGCDAGGAADCGKLGLRYELGLEVPKDLGRAASLYERACEHKDNFGCVRLARSYETGSGVAKDASRAGELYKQACTATPKLCTVYADDALLGRQYPKDLELARTLYDVACELGEGNACGSLAEFYFEGWTGPRDLALAASLQRKGCDLGAAPSCYLLATAYDRGAGVPTDPRRAAELYQRACDGGFATGCKSLGRRYQAGNGVPKDPARAAVLLRKACDGGEATTCEGLRLWRIAELRLVGTARPGGTPHAYLMNARGSFWPVETGQEVLDGRLEALADGSVTFKRGDGTVETLRLAESGAPPPPAADPRSKATPIDVDFDGEIGAFARLVADASGRNVVVEGGATGRVRAAGRQAPWDAVFERALKDGGFDHAVHGLVTFVGRPESVRALRPPTLEPSGKPISLDVGHGDVDDLAALFSEFSGLSVQKPPSPCGPIAIAVHELPWDQALGWVAAACGWTTRLEGRAVHLEVPTP